MYKNYLFGDGSFTDCVRIASVLDGSCDISGVEDVQSVKEDANALRNPLIPQCVVEYAVSCEGSHRKHVMLDSRYVSDQYVVERLKEVLDDDEKDVITVSLQLPHHFDCINDVMDYLHAHKLFVNYEKFCAAQSKVGGASAKEQLLLEGFGVEVSKIAERLGVSVLLLKDLSTCFPTPLQVLEECAGFDADPAVLAHLFFNKHLTMDDVRVLLERMPLDFGNNMDELRHLLLFRIVLLREDWTVDELRFLYSAWLDFVKRVEVDLLKLESGEFHTLLPPSTMWKIFQVWKSVVGLLFAANKAMPCDLLLKVFVDGDSRIQAAVVRNPAVGANFVSAVLDGDVSAVSGMCSVSVSEGDVAVLREHAARNSVASFEQLLKIAENETEEAEVRFEALFNENVPSLYRVLYSD